MIIGGAERIDTGLPRRRDVDLDQRLRVCRSADRELGWPADWLRYKEIQGGGWADRQPGMPIRSQQLDRRERHCRFYRPAGRAADPSPRRAAWRRFVLWLGRSLLVLSRRGCGLLRDRWRGGNK